MAALADVLQGADRKNQMNSWHNKLFWKWAQWRERWGVSGSRSMLPLLILLFLILQLLLGVYWSREQPSFAVLTSGGGSLRPGQVMAATLVHVGGVLVEKPGGFLRNDVMPPGLLLDNTPAWERGVLNQVRDLVRVLNRDRDDGMVPLFEDPYLAEAEAAFGVREDSWVMPSAESEIVRGNEALLRYSQRLGRGGDLRFAPREMHLRLWLADVNGRLGEMSVRLNAALPPYWSGGEVAESDSIRVPQTSWWKIDDVFYEARGSAWTLLHLLKAAEIDFGPQLARHRAELSLRAAIHELEATQQTIWSPLILNGSGFGLFGNHSLVMANYLHRAQANLADVQLLMQQPLVPDSGSKP
jgi:hypothetical protein